MIELQKIVQSPFLCSEYQYAPVACTYAGSHLAVTNSSIALSTVVPWNTHCLICPDLRSPHSRNVNLSAVLQILGHSRAACAPVVTGVFTMSTGLSATTVLLQFASVSEVLRHGVFSTQLNSALRSA